jgi:hypothetical protein
LSGLAYTVVAALGGYGKPPAFAEVDRVFAIRMLLTIAIKIE